MNTESPTLDQLRSRAQKGRHRELGNWLARRISRPSAIYGTWVAVRLGLSAHQVTAAALVASLAGAAAIGAGTPAGFVAGVIALHLGYWLDHVDGQVARWRGSASLDGVYLDYLMHHVVNMSIGFALGYGLAARTGQPAWTLAGFAVALGWAMLSLHNDCRYKAFFQRLKASSETYRVDGGSGGRPSPPAPWPRRGPGMVTWPLLKACEPHGVLLWLTGLAFLAVAAPDGWITCWRAATLVMAVLAPLLGAARVIRAVGRGAAEREFGRWFRQETP
ncbi:CDP-alcohol phosphatidyltransferase family protein [Aquisphaera insulae]|uniref:CDP-alcohol phosphatidyltransferase family protein n=1 Tax=Aquisphaera insulae TaxID=2712864 RepID=UPI0013EA4C0A|nr:CDP-alcohol phosphatidyltransferase family protein [Aquisphaera insulae]